MIKSIEEIFKKTLELPQDVDFKTVKYNEILSWDSIVHMQLVAELEKKFDIMMDFDDVIGLSSFEKAIEILKKYDIIF